MGRRVQSEKSFKLTLGVCPASSFRSTLEHLPLPHRLQRPLLAAWDFWGACPSSALRAVPLKQPLPRASWAARRPNERRTMPKANDTYFRWSTALPLLPSNGRCCRGAHSSSRRGLLVLATLRTTAPPLRRGSGSRLRICGAHHIVSYKLYSTRPVDGEARLAADGSSEVGEMEGNALCSPSSSSSTTLLASSTLSSGAGEADMVRGGGSRGGRERRMVEEGGGKGMCPGFIDYFALPNRVLFACISANSGLSYYLYGIFSCVDWGSLEFAEYVINLMPSLAVPLRVNGKCHFRSENTHGPASLSTPRISPPFEGRRPLFSRVFISQSSRALGARWHVQRKSTR